MPPSSPVIPVANSKNWAHRLFQNPAMLDSSLVSTGRHGGVHTALAGTSPEKDKQDQPSVSDVGLSASLNAVSATPTVAPKSSISRLAFPFSAHRRRVVPPGPPSPPSPINPRSVPEAPVRRKHVFVSSPLCSSQASGRGIPSSHDAVLAQAKPRRSHHGHSQHSLLLTKWVWSSRRAHHEEHPTQGDVPRHPLPGAAPLAGVASLPTLHPNHRPRLHRRMPSVYTEEKKPDQPPLTMYPRQGDISALRDPYCARADRSFATVPLWTLNKILYLFALHLPLPSITEDSPADAFEDAGSEVSFNTESEGSTMVGSECDSEWDSRSVSTACSSRQDVGDDDMTYGDHDTIGRMKGHNLLSLAVRRVSREPDVCTSHLTSPSWLRRVYRNPRADGLKLTIGQSSSSWERRHRKLLQTKNTWPSDWYGLWELLIDLAARDGPAEAGSMTPTEGRKAKLRAPPPKEFRWLKLLGNKGVGKPAKPVPVVSPLGSLRTAGVVQTNGSVKQISSGGAWLPLLESSHPAAG